MSHLPMIFSEDYDKDNSPLCKAILDGINSGLDHKFDPEKHLALLKAETS